MHLIILKKKTYFFTGSVPESYKPISSSSHLHVFENGSLTILDVSEHDAGYYLCQASNGIGSGLSKVISLTVHGNY